MELWDAYNQNLEQIEDMTLIRGETIPEGVFHLVSDVIVRHTDGSYLLMQRDNGKHFGGMWEATAGGSALRGETALACAIRELWEETGIESNTLTEVGRVVSAERHTIYVEFLCVTDWPKDHIRLQDGETMAFQWVSRDELLSMKRDQLVTERMHQFIDELKTKESRVPEYDFWTVCESEDASHIANGAGGILPIRRIPCKQAERARILAEADRWLLHETCSAWYDYQFYANLGGEVAETQEFLIDNDQILVRNGTFFGVVISLPEDSLPLGYLSQTAPRLMYEVPKADHDIEEPSVHYLYELKQKLVGQEVR